MSHKCEKTIEKDGNNAEIRNSDMNRIDDKRCWYTPNDITVGCDCHRVYFQVYINFETTVISFCKDWWNGRFSELWAKKVLDLNIPPHDYSGFLTKDRAKHIRQDMLYQIIDEFVESQGGYFSNAPTINKSIYPYASTYKTHRRNVFLDTYQSIEIMERPRRIVYVSNKTIFESMANGESTGSLGQRALDDAWQVLRDDPYFRGSARTGAYTIYKKIRDRRTSPDERAILVNELLLRYFKIHIVKKSKSK